jgi:hypothetical protein
MDMKIFVSAIALAVAVAAAGPAFAGDATVPKTKAACEKAGGEWDAATDKCTGK